MMRPALFLFALAAACSSGVPRSTPTLRVHHYPDGRPHFQYALRENIPHGEGVVWHRNGELKSRGEYVNGVKHGIFKFYGEDGAFQSQAMYWKDVEVWRSTTSNDRPSDELLAGLTKFSGTEPRLGAETRAGYEVVRSPGIKLDTSPPAPLFASLDRTTSFNRVGLQFGFSDAGSMGAGAVQRIDVFGNYRLSEFGIYGQFSQATLDTSFGPALTGRSTIEAGGTYHLPLALGGLSIRGGLAVPLTNDDSDGFLAATAGSFQRPTDAATSVPSSIALRTGASMTRSLGEWLVLQGDTGVDWVVGGANGFDALVRANVGAGFGIRSVMFSVEASNTLRLAGPSRRIQALAMGPTFWINKTWLMLSLVLGSDSHTTLSGALGYEL